MNLGEFRQLTNLLPDTTEIWILADGAWRGVGTLSTRKDQALFTCDPPAPDDYEDKASYARIASFIYDEKVELRIEPQK